MKDLRENGRSYTLFLTTALEGARVQRYAPGATYLQERSGIHCKGGWVGLRVGLDMCGKFRPHRVSISGPSSP
jgi:hypothetical protein